MRSSRITAKTDVRGFNSLVDLHVLADKLQDIISMNLVVDQVFHRRAPRLQDVAYAYERTTAGSLNRSLMRDVSIHRVGRVLEDERDTTVPGIADALLDIYEETLQVVECAESALAT